MSKSKYLFIDRDGTLIVEPADEQVDSVDKLEFMPGVFSALSRFKQAGYKLVMVTNQDGLGTESLKEEDFIVPHELMLKIFKSQGIEFESIKICPHLPDDGCDCRKPKIGLLLDYMKAQTIDKQNSYVIGDRQTDRELADNLGIGSQLLGNPDNKSWIQIASAILDKPRSANVKRKTNETDIELSLNFDTPGEITIDTGIEFFNHMLEQFAKHSGMSITLKAIGDLDIDDHHTVEDVAIVLGEGIRNALGDKRGIGRYGFLLPMDESLAKVVLDLSGRPSCHFNAIFNREIIGDFSTELVSHFFRSLTDSLRASLHIDIQGENTHHMIESAFKGVGRTLQQALRRDSTELPTTKGVL